MERREWDSLKNQNVPSKIRYAKKLHLVSGIYLNNPIATKVTSIATNVTTKATKVTYNG